MGAALPGGRTTAKKPVQLQLKNSGSWKTVVRFDAADEHQADPAMEAAEMLHRLNPHSAWRIATEGALPMVLMRLDEVQPVWRPV